MYPDVIDLRDFYTSPLGRVVRHVVGSKIRTRWPKIDGQVVVGLGYATPYLGAFAVEAERVAAFMPAGQGVVHWPADQPFRTALVDEYDLPLPDGSVDRMLMVHALEMAEAPQALLREAWRVLAPGGRLIAVVPNRRGLWARLDTTPFGHGRPFSRGQLTDLLREAMFSPSGWAGALAMPPFNLRLLLRYATAWERVGVILTPGFEGVLIVEATKQVYAPVPVRRARPLAARLKPVLAPPTPGAARKASA